MICEFKHNPLSAILSKRGLEEGGTVQKFVDNAVLHYCDPYTPKDSGDLIKSGERGTVLGSGKVTYNTPYAREQYYNTADTRSYDPQRGGQWFERMKADHKEDILHGAAKKAGGKAK